MHDDYYKAKKKFIRHKWRGKRFCVFDKEMFFLDTLALEIAREVDTDIVNQILAVHREMNGV